MKYSVTLISDDNYEKNYQKIWNSSLKIWIAKNLWILYDT